MIVSENNVHDALAYLAIDPHPIALARKDLTDAENAAKRTYAEAFLNASGAVESRKAAAELNQTYQSAREDEAAAVMELERHRARIKAAEMLLDCWRTENANVRAAERVR